MYLPGVATLPYPLVQEIGCNIPSNLHGPNPIRFPAGKIHTVYEQVKGVLQREGML